MVTPSSAAADAAMKAHLLLILPFVARWTKARRQAASRVMCDAGYEERSLLHAVGMALQLCGTPRGLRTKDIRAVLADEQLFDVSTLEPSKGAVSSATRADANFVVDEMRGVRTLRAPLLREADARAIAASAAAAFKLELAKCVAI
jgi:hypothetical protein